MDSMHRESIMNLIQDFCKVVQLSRSINDDNYRKRQDSVYAHTRTHARTHTHTHTRTHAHSHTRTLTHTHTYSHTHMNRDDVGQHNSQRPLGCEGVDVRGGVQVTGLGHWGAQPTWIPGGCLVCSDQ